jgi:uncharacterized membrane protein YcfT
VRWPPSEEGTYPASRMTDMDENLMTFVNVLGALTFVLIVVYHLVTGIYFYQTKFISHVIIISVASPKDAEM